MINEINAEREKSDRLTVEKLNAVKQFNKEDHKSKLMTEKYSLLPLSPQQLTPVQTAIQMMSEKHPDFEIEPVNTIRPPEIKYTQTPQALVPIIYKHIPRQSDIDKIVKNIETHVIHSLELPIQAQDLIKAYKHSTRFHDIYQYIMIAVPLRDWTAQTVAEALIYRVIYLFRPPRQIICDEATEFSSAIIQAILCMLNCRLKVISPYNHGSSKCERQIRTISEIIMKHLWDKEQMWPLFATTSAYTMNTFASEALSGLSPFQLVFLRDPPDLTSLSFPKIDTIPVKHREYYNLLLARAQLVGNLLLEWRTKQALEYESRAKKFRNEDIFQDNQMVYLLAPHASVLQTNTTKFKLDFIGPLFIDTTLDKTHYKLKDTTGLLLDGMYHVKCIKKGSACTPLGIVDKFDTYETALKNTLLNKFAIETPNNKLQEVTLQDGSKELNYLPGTIMDYASLQS